MRYIVISDIHGAISNISKILDKENYDKIILLGDILYHGPRNDVPSSYNPKELINILNNKKDIISWVKGNCDAAVDNMVLDFPMFDIIKLIINNHELSFTHGDIYNPASPLNQKDGYVIYGHTHIKDIKKINNVTYINPGSISIPKDDIASYIIIDNDEIEIKDINLNIITKIKL